MRAEIIVETRYGMDETAIAGMRHCDADDRWDATFEVHVGGDHWDMISNERDSGRRMGA